MPELVALWERAGLREIRTGVIEIDARYSDFADYWSPFEFGIGPAGEYLTRCDEDRKARLRNACIDLLGRPTGGFTLPARVLAVRGVV